MRQIVAAAVSPMPSLDILQVPCEGPEAPNKSATEDSQPDTGDGSQREPTGFYVVAVPRSPLAPHAVIVNDGFRYPKRNGATTRYLSEPEIAAAYRDRFAGVEAQARRIELVEREAAERLDRSRWPWLLVSLVPDLPGYLDITHAVQQEFHERTVGHPTQEILRGYVSTFHQASVGRRRLLADGANPPELKASWASAEYLSDGSGA